MSGHVLQTLWDSQRVEQLGDEANKMEWGSVQILGDKAVRLPVQSHPPALTSPSSVCPHLAPRCVGSCEDGSCAGEGAPSQTQSGRPQNKQGWKLRVLPSALLHQPQPNWTKVVNKKLKFPPPLFAIQEGWLDLVQQLLELGRGTGSGSLQDVQEANDHSWREALSPAILLAREAITCVLLANVRFDFWQIHEALLVAVDTDQSAGVHSQLGQEREKGHKVNTRSFSLAFFDSSVDVRFAPGVTPLTLACQKDLYGIAQLLTEQGHTITQPHPVSCACLECSSAHCYDLLKFSLSCINTYHGIASRAHLSLASEDSMLAAFQLSRELRHLPRKEPEFKFVAHPICQQALSSIWGMSPLSKDWGEQRPRKQEQQALQAQGRKTLGCLLKIPVLQCLLHSASCLWFLTFLLGESLLTEVQLSTFCGRSQSIWETSLHLVWVTGFLWFEYKEVWIEGLRSYFLAWWNFLDVVILPLSLATFALHLLAGLAQMYCQDVPHGAACHYFTSAERSEWHTEDPQFLAEVLFAVTSMLSFTHLAYILSAYESLGTHISIGKVTDDMIPFMFILMIILTAFLCGLNNIYVPYQKTEQLGNFNETFQFLFWTMFGMEEHSMGDMPQFLVPEFVNRTLYGIFTIIRVIVLLNVLIAMITNFFQKIEDDPDVEKFARSKLNLSYLQESLTLQPFNILPSLKAIFYLLRRIFWFICCCCSCCKIEKPDYPPIPTFTNLGAGAGAGSRKGEDGSYHLHIIKAQVQRYIETARWEFERTVRKVELGSRLTELTKTVFQLQSEVAGVWQTAEGGTPQPPDGASIFGRYITKLHNRFQNLPSPGPIAETSELIVPGTVGTQVASETELEDTRGAGTPAPRESSPSSPAHVLVHRQQESEWAGDLPWGGGYLGTKEGSCCSGRFPSVPE
ncbi:LOW QUALITY PROTEIN: short transient receptor potential channel 2-like [Rhynchonycteris naso]